MKTKNEQKNRAIANRATTSEARSIRRDVQKWLKGPALEMARALDYDMLAKNFGK